MAKIINAESSAEVAAKLKAKLVAKGANNRMFAQWSGMNESWVSRILGGRHDNQVSTLIDIEKKIDEFLS